MIMVHLPNQVLEQRPNSYARLPYLTAMCFNLLFAVDMWPLCAHERTSVVEQPVFANLALALVECNTQAGNAMLHIEQAARPDSLHLRLIAGKAWNKKVWHHPLLQSPPDPSS